MDPAIFPSPYFRGLILITAIGFMALEYDIARLAQRGRTTGARARQRSGSRSGRT